METWMAVSSPRTLKSTSEFHFYHVPGDVCADGPGITLENHCFRCGALRPHLGCLWLLNLFW